MVHSMPSVINSNIELKTGNWLLVVGGRAIVPTLLKMTARLAETGPVRVIDCGNVFDPYTAGNGTRGGLKVLKRIQVSKASSCHAVLETLEKLASEPAPFIVLDLLRTFHHTNVEIDERKRLLRLSLEELNRLKRGAEGLVSVHPPKVLCQAESDLLEIVTRAAKDTYHLEMALPVFSFAGRN